MKRIYSEENLKWLKKHYPTMLLSDLVPAFNKAFNRTQSLSSVKGVLKRNGITCGSRKGRRKGILRSWSNEQAAWVQNAYTHMSYNDMPNPFFKEFGVHKLPSQFRSLTRNQRYISGRDCKFKPGHVPVNKGTKGLTGANAGSFKKGQIPHNEVPMWSERVDKEGYVWIKIPEHNPHTDTNYIGRFVFKHRYIWEKENGNIPKGMALVFTDGDRSNCEINNLELVKRSELLYLNQHFSDVPSAVRPSAIATSKLAVKIQSVVK